MQDPFNSTQAKSLASYYGYAPKSVVKGEGVYLYDKNNCYLDCGMALGSVSLGYGYKEVDDYVIEHLRQGVNFSRPSYIEEALTEKIRQDLHDTDLVIRYSKSSSMLLSVLPRIARFFGKKRYIAYPQNCFLGNTDWYLSKCTNSGGIIPEIRDLTITFKNGDCEALKNLFESYKNDLSCIVMEPYREKEYSEEFYKTLRNLCNINNVFLIFDETVTGYRFYHPLAQKKINCKPDFTVIGKAFANGYSLACAIGSSDIMSKLEKSVLSGEIFDFSTTHAGETLGLAAAIKTLDIYSTESVIRKINDKGNYLYHNFKEIISKYDLSEVFKVAGQPSYFKVMCIANKDTLDIIKNLYKFFFENNILFKGIISLSLSHEQKDMDQILDCFQRYCQQFDQYKF